MDLTVHWRTFDRRRVRTLLLGTHRSGLRACHCVDVVLRACRCGQQIRLRTDKVANEILVIMCDHCRRCVAAFRGAQRLSTQRSRRRGPRGPPCMGGHLAVVHYLRRYWFCSLFHFASHRCGAATSRPGDRLARGNDQTCRDVCFNLRDATVCSDIAELFPCFSRWWTANRCLGCDGNCSSGVFLCGRYFFVRSTPERRRRISFTDHHAVLCSGTVVRNCSPAVHV